MGFAKKEWMETEERGWAAPVKYVCANCFEDGYLSSVVAKNASQNYCDYCQRKSAQKTAAPLSAALAPIAETLFAYFADPASAGLPRDLGEWVGEESITYTQDALEELGLICNEQLFEDIVSSFLNNAWYPCAGGHWLGMHEHEELNSAWEDFVSDIKHRSRYFFIRHKAGASNDMLGERYTPLTLLHRIGKAVQTLGLIKTLSVGTHLYRVRRVSEGMRFKKFEEVGLKWTPQSRH